MKKSINSLFFVPSVCLCVCLLFSVSSCNSDSTSKEDKRNENQEISDNLTLTSTSTTNLEENNYSTNNNEQQPNSIRPVYSDNDANTDEQDLYQSLSAQDSSEFFKRFAPKTQTFKFSNNDEQDIYCQLGTYIHIDSASFVFEDGSPVTSPVIFEVKEFYDKQTVLLSGLATNTKGGFLESGGMLHLEATSNGKKVKLQKEIDIEMPTYNTNTRSKNGMKVYLASNNKSNFSKSSDLNDVNNPPSVWQTDGDEIGVQKIPMKRNFFNLRFLHRKNEIDENQSYKNDCKCYDISLISEKIEALSEEIDVEEDKNYSHNPRTIKSKNSTKKVLTSRKRSFYKNSNDTAAYEDYKVYTTSFYQNTEKEDDFVYDTIQFVIETHKDKTAKVVEILKDTRNAIDYTSSIHSINTSGGLRFQTGVSFKNGVCKNQKTTFYIQSVDLWKDILKDGKDNFKTWKKTQRNSEENYTISYKKRKKPILVWTGIIKTTKKAFVEDYQITRALRYYFKMPNETKQAAYNAYRQKYVARHEEYLAKNAGTLSATKELDSYVFKTMDLGWINCDRFYSVPKEQKVDLLVNSHTPVRVIFNKINAVMEGTQNGKQNTFSAIPKGEPITIFGIRKKGEKLFMAFEQTKVGKDPINVTYKEVTFEEMQKTLANL